MSCDKGQNMDNPSGPYFPQVKMIIENNCLSCHSSAGNWEGRPTAFDNDSAISVQYAAIKAAVADPISPVNKRMPKDGMLSQHDIDIIVNWYDKGGKTTD
jgi:uncharacterized membrane protein